MTGRFVVLHHELPAEAERPSHWDLMWQAGDVLRAWALDDPPRPGTATIARPLPDHRSTYLDYEGPVSANRGRVTRHDAGTFQLLRDEAGSVVVRLAGTQYQGEVLLQADGEHWQAIFSDGRR